MAKKPSHRTPRLEVRELQVRRVPHLPPGVAPSEDSCGGIRLTVRQCVGPSRRGSSAQLPFQKREALLEMKKERRVLVRDGGVLRPLSRDYGGQACVRVSP